VASRARSPHDLPRSRAALERSALDRAAGVLERLFAHAPTAALRKLVDEASLAAVTSALSAAVAAAPGADPLAAARSRGVLRRDDLMNQAGGALSPGELAERTGMSRQTVNNWRRKGQVIAIPRGRRDFVFPACQLGEDRLLPGLDRVLAASALRHPLGQLEMLLAPSPRMGGASPLALLRGGRVEDAVALAAASGSALDDGASAAPALPRTARA
jgi:hypothetical protein